MVSTQNSTTTNDKISKNFLNPDSNFDEIEFSDAISENSLNSDNSDGENGLEICPEGSENFGNFGKIVVQNSSDVHFGNKTFYQGPVTIKQFLYNNTISDTKLCVEDGEITKNISANGSCTTSNESCETLEEGTERKIEKINGTQNGTPFVNLVPNVKEKWWKIRRLEEVPVKVKISLLCSLVLILILIILFATYGIVKQISGKSFLDGSRVDSDEQDVVEPIPLPLDPDAPPSYSRKLRIITRGQWVAQPPVQPADKLKTPVPYVIILHTATDNCTDFATCVFRVRYIQSFHIDSNGWWDIGYNFLVGGDGLAYEGRGWTNEGAHTYGYNKDSIGIAFIGTFNYILPPPAQIDAAKKLIQQGVEKGYIAKDYKLFAHRQLSSTQSPGHLLYEDIKKWPHWANRPDMYSQNDSLTSKNVKNDTRTENDKGRVDNTTVKSATFTVTNVSSTVKSDSSVKNDSLLVT